MNEFILTGKEPEIKLDGPVREPILKLGSMVTNRLFYKVKPEDPEYWGLALLISDEEAELALKMKRRVPRTLKNLVELTGKPASELTPLLDHMSLVGVLEWNYENAAHEKQWVLPMFVPGSSEFANMNIALLEEHPELGRFFERCGYLPLAGITQLVPPGGAGIGMHTIPVEKAISHESQSLDIEHISYWMKKYDKYAASPCSCRLMCKTFDEGCGDDPMDWCIAVGDMADYVVETRKGGRYISYDEAMDIFQKAEERGYVHQITNIDGEKKIFAICNCNLNVCVALRTSQLFNTPNLSRSAYVAKVESTDCVACGRCVEYCPAGAVKLGQKLCTKSGAIEYPKHELPDAKKWGEDKWDVNYRDTNRINCYDTGTAPCKTACPAHIAVQGYLKKAAQGKYTEALELIKRENPFPAVCGAICNRRCEDACTRGTIDEAIAIDEVKKFIAAQDLKAETRFVPAVVKPSVDDTPWQEKIAIIGGGPAGLSCAYYLAVQGYKPTVFEKEQHPGGMLMNGIPSFRLEKDVVEAEIDIIKSLGVEFRCGVEVGKDVTIDELRSQGYKAFYISIGCQGGRMVGVPGEEAEGVMTGVDFLRNVNLSQNGTKLTGATVVIGGGIKAVEASLAALSAGSTKVAQICLEARGAMTAPKSKINEAEAAGVAIAGGWAPHSIHAENGKVTGIAFKRCEYLINDKGSFAPKFDPSALKVIDCDNVIIAGEYCTDLRKMLTGLKDSASISGVMEAEALINSTADGVSLTGDTVVIGGGNVAVDVARTAERVGDGKVSMFCLESRDIMPAADDEIAEAESEGISVNCGWGPHRIQVENGKVVGISLKKCISVFDEEHKFNPQYDVSTLKMIPCSNVLMSVGQSIQWGELLKDTKVELGRGNGAVADAVTYQTAEPDIFVGGDVYTGPKFAIDAIAAGKEGAYSIHRFVQPHCTMTVGRNLRKYIELDKNNIAVTGYDVTPRQIPDVSASAQEAAKSFRDSRLPFTEEQVKAETARCLGCGASVVDPNKCIGCGVCTTKCAFDAIKLHREHPECSKMVVSEDKVKALLPYMAKRGIKILFSKKES